MATREVIKVRTVDRLYVGAKLEVGTGVIRRVVREDASRSCGSETISVVEVEPTIVCVGDWTIDAELV